MRNFREFSFRVVRGIRGTIAEDRRGIIDALDAYGGPLQVS
jgi:hypothetical protein